MKKILLNLVLGILFVGLVVGASINIKQPNATFSNGINIDSIIIKEIDGKEYTRIDFTGTSKEVSSILESYGIKKEDSDYLNLPFLDINNSKETVEIVMEILEDLDTSKPRVTHIVVPVIIESGAGKQYDFEDGEFK